MSDHAGTTSGTTLATSALTCGNHAGNHREPLTRLVVPVSPVSNGEPGPSAPSESKR